MKATINPGTGGKRSLVKPLVTAVPPMLKSAPPLMVKYHRGLQVGISTIGFLSVEETGNDSGPANVLVEIPPAIRRLRVKRTRLKCLVKANAFIREAHRRERSY